MTPTGQGNNTLLVDDCDAYQICTTSGGVAKCVTAPGKCLPNSSKCIDTATKAVCNASGDYQNQACPGCKPSALGATCAPVATKLYKGKIQYEFRGPLSDYSGWGPVGLAPAVGLYAVSYWKTGNALAPLDSTVVGSNGDFQIQFPSTPGPEDRIVFFALREADDGSGIAFAVAHPDVPDGEQPLGPIPNSDNTYYWQWSADKTVLTNPNNVDLTIPESLTSGAVRVFDYLRYVHGSLTSVLGKPGESLVIWLRPNTTWSCGVCFLSVPHKSAAVGSFDSQMFIPANAIDMTYWSDAVTAHELGHWAMDAFGTPPGEGGYHQLGCTSFPGLAWSEGWATAHSSIARQSPYYYDKQQGSFFYVNLATHSYSGGWVLPQAGLGINQPIDEDHVASMVYGLSVPVAAGVNPFPSNKHLLNALSSPLLKSPKRGYTQHGWTPIKGSCAKTNIVDYKIPVPQFADFLDALLCGGGATAAKVDAVTAPKTHFPYPSSTPICN